LQEPDNVSATAESPAPARSPLHRHPPIPVAAWRYLPVSLPYVSWQPYPERNEVHRSSDRRGGDGHCPCTRLCFRAIAQPRPFPRCFLAWSAAADEAGRRQRPSTASVACMRHRHPAPDPHRGPVCARNRWLVLVHRRGHLGRSWRCAVRLCVFCHHSGARLESRVRRARLPLTAFSSTSQTRSVRW